LFYKKSSVLKKKIRLR